MPIKDKEGASDGGKVCSYKGPTLSSSTATIPLVSRKGNVYEYLHTARLDQLINYIATSCGVHHLHVGTHRKSPSQSP